MKTISVLIPDGDHPLTLRVMRSLGLSKRVTVDLLTSDRRSHYRLSRFCRRCHVTSSHLTDHERCDAVLRTIETADIDVVLPVSQAGVRLVTKAGQALSQQVALPPLPDTAALDLADDKIALYRFAQSHGISTPPSLVFPDEASDDGALGRLPYPVLLKPPSLDGGKGIRQFDDAQTLAGFLESYREHCLLQSYLEGLDFGLNVLCRDGEILAYTVQRNVLSASPPFGSAAGIHFIEDAEVLETGRRLLAALRWNGVANLDMLRCTATGATMVLEINPRYWATLLGSVHAGVNFPYLACLAALGQPFPQTESQPITYADQSTAIKQTLKRMAGRPHLAGLRLRNTALWMSFTDPLPTATYYGNRLLETAAGYATKPFRRRPNNPQSTYGKCRDNMGEKRT